MRGTSLAMRITLATAGMVLLALFTANLLFNYAGRGRSDREFAHFAYQRANWLAGELEARMRGGRVDKETQAFLSRSAREMDLSIVLLLEADDPVVTAHGPSLARMLRVLKDQPDLGHLTDRGETPWEPSFDGSTDRSRYPDRGRRAMRVQEHWPYAVEAPVKANMTLRIVPLSQDRLREGAFGRGLVGAGMILLLGCVLVGGRVAAPLEVLASQVAAAGRGSGGHLGVQPFDEAQAIARAVNGVLDRLRRVEAARDAVVEQVAQAFVEPARRLFSAAGALKVRSLPEGERATAEELQRQAEDLRSTAEDLHRWVGLEGGELELDLQDVPLRPALEAARGDDLGELALDDDVDEALRADPEWLAILLDHVVQLVRDRGDGGLRIHASRGHTKIELSLRDGGTGTTDIDELRHLFDPFQAGDGLGLRGAIARLIVALHQGGLSARNHPEGGLELRLWLPAPPIRVSEPDRAIAPEVWAAAGASTPAASVPVAPAGRPAPAADEDPAASSAANEPGAAAQTADGLRADDEAQADDEPQVPEEDPYSPF